MVSTSMLLCILCTIFVISFPRASVAAGLDYRFSIKSEATGPQIFNPNGLAMRTSGGTQEIAITEIDGHRVSVYNAATGALIRTIGAPGIANGQLNHPHAVAYANADFIVADTHNNRIQRFSSTGTYMWQSGTTGTASGAAEFMYPESLAVSVANSEIYVADTLNHRVVILNLNDGSYKSEFGGFNEDPQSFSGFNEPRGIAVDSTGKLLVADSRNNRIVIIPRNSNTYAMGDASVLDTSSWDAGWNFPVSVSVDSSDNAIVSDFRNTRVVRGSQGGTFLGFVGGAPGTDMTQIQYPKSALYDGTYYYIADAGNGCLTVLLADGTASTRNIAKKTSFPSVLGPQGVTVTPKGGIVVADTLHHRINFYMPNGTLDYEWAPIGEMGTWALYHPGQLSIVNINDPTAQDGIGVADTKNHRIVSVWKASGQWDRFGDFGSYGRDINSKQFNSPKAVASCFDQVWVADTMNHRVVQFNNILGDVMFNTYPAQPGTVPSVYVPSSANGEFNMPSALVCTSQYLYVADSGNNRVQIFSWSTGNNNVQYVDSVAVNYPVGLGMAKGDLLYVTSLFDATVTAFQIQGNGLLVASAADDFGGLGSTDGLFKTPNGLSATQNAYMFATDTLNNKVQGFCEVLTYTANDAKLQTTSYDKQELVTFAGPGPFTFNIVSGTVIPGTTFSTTDTALVISGTPADAAAGNTYPFTISVTDAFGCSTGDFAISLEVFERITLSGYTVSDNDTRGGGLLEITGTRFTAIADPIIYIGDGVLVPKRLCSQNDGVISDTTLRCVVPEGVGKLNKVIVEVAGTVYVFANLFAYGAPMIDSITTNVPTLHQSDPVFFITINGKNFGNEPYAGGYIQHFSVAGLGCYGGNPAFVDTQSIVIRCEAPESVGTANPLRLSIGNYPGDAQEVRSTVSYVPATVTDCDDVSTHNIVAHPGQTVVTICGADFGNPTYDPQWTGHRAIRVGRQPCDSVEWTWDKAICVVPSNQMGANNKVTLDVNGVLVKANMTVSFLPPHVTSLAPLSIQTAGNVLTINGGNFGADASRVNVKIGVNGYCSGIVLLSQSKLYCKAYGSGANQAVVVTVEGQVSDGWVVVDFTKPTDGLSCHSPLGAQDQFADDRCNCYSGYAPSNERGIDCNVKATCAPRDVSSTVVVMEYVKHIQFKDDKVLVKIDAPILHNARDFHISFTSAQGSTCNYPGPIWEKTVDALDCRDVYTAAMPWSANGLCGFNLTGSSIHSNKRVVTPTQYNYHTAPVTLTMRLIQGNIQRKVSSSFLLSVKFATQLQVSTVAITTLEPYLEAQLVTFNIINGYSTLDLDNPQYIIEFETSVINKFELSTLTGSVNNISTSVVVVPNAAGPGEALCSRGDCVQQWVATVNIPSPCDGATVILIPQLICRDPEDICDVVNIYAGNATLLIAANKDANCGVEKNADATDGLSVSILTYENFNNQDLSNTMLVNDLVSGPEQNTFVGRNSKIMVLVKVVEPQTSIDMITLNSLTIQGDFPDQILYQVTTPGVRNTPLIPEAKLNFTELRRSGHDAVALSPNQEGYLALAFTLYDLPVSPDAPVSVEISIAIDLFYHGNDGDRKKRSFISDLPVDPTNTIEKSKIIFVEYENNNEYDEEAQNAETLLDDGIGWSFSSASRVAKIELLVASLLVAVIALVL